jgi:PKD repeat protein
LTKTALRSTPRRLAGIAFLAMFVLLALAAQARAIPTGTATTTWSPNPPTRPSIGQTITFTVTPTWDGEPGTATWDFGDGSSATGLTVTHSYTAPGLKFASVTLTNGDDPAETSAPILAWVTVNAPPQAAFGWSPTTGTTGEDVHFASESDDPDGTIASYDWDFGDGVTDSRRNPEHPFNSPGTKTVTLTVTDASGATSTVVHEVVVADPPPQPTPLNRPPTANFAFGPRSPQVGDPVEFASSAVDPEGELRSQTWDLDGDGQFDDARGDEVLYTFASSGTKTVRLRVEDEAGNADVHERTISVRPRPVAKAGFLSPSPVISLNAQILGNGARVQVLRVSAPKGSLATVRCKGKGCPVKQRRKRVKKGGTVRFKTYERFLRAGTKLEIFVTKRNTIGSYTSYKIRAGKFPTRVRRCTPPGKLQARRCGSL